MKALHFLPVLLLSLQTLPADPVIIHEWGTFTCLQDEQGHAIAGINIDDEPVPYFVRHVAIEAVPQYGPAQAWRNLGLPPYQLEKEWIAGDPQVTMRLETPVLYIYPPKGREPSSVPPLNVRVDFHGGVLSQYYPNADFSGLPFRKFPNNPELDGKFPYIDKDHGLTEKTITSLDWKAVHFGSTEKPFETTDKVWTTPREVSAPILSVKFSETDNAGIAKSYTQAEHFLFYRGVGHLDSPLKIHCNEAYPQDVGVNKTSRLQVITNGCSPQLFRDGWLVDIREDGQCAYKKMFLDESVWGLGDFPNGAGPIMMMKNSTVDIPRAVSEIHPPTEYDPENLTKLKASMQEALVKEGLYPDEASAMLRTWELSYFKSPGLRFFYIVPRTWVDKVLPLKVTGAKTEITRVMVGRIELITDEQKDILAKLAAGPCPDLATVKKAAQDALRNGKFSPEEIEAFCRGEKPLSQLGIPIPPLVQDYLNLGRFRDALIVHEQIEQPTPALAQFIKDNQLLPVTN